MVLGAIKRALGLVDDGPNGAAALKAALREEPTSVELEGYYEEPYLDPVGANTAVFPVQVTETRTGSQYERTKVEFEIEHDGGKENLDVFLGQHGIEDRENLDEIEGQAVNIGLDAMGNTIVDW